MAPATPSQEQGDWGTLGQPQSRASGTSLGMGIGWGWDGLSVHVRGSGLGPVMRTGVRCGPGMATRVPSGPPPATWSLCAGLSISDWEQVVDREGLGFPYFGLKPDKDQRLARPVLHYVLSKLSAGCGPGSNFPAIFPAADWSALNVAFILL